MMLEGAGFEVINLGINTDAEEFLAALEEHEPDILGMSALLTTTHALYEGGDRRPERAGHSGGLHRVGGRRSPQRGVRGGGGRRRLLPGRGRRRRDCPDTDRQAGAPMPEKGVGR